jgi:hypothetical protein
LNGELAAEEAFNPNADLTTPLLTWAFARPEGLEPPTDRVRDCVLLRAPECWIHAQIPI